MSARTDWIATLRRGQVVHLVQADDVTRVDVMVARVGRTFVELETASGLLRVDSYGYAPRSMIVRIEPVPGHDRRRPK